MEKTTKNNGKNLFMNTKIQIKTVNGGVIPTWNNKSAGCDLSSTENYTLRPRERKLFKTGLYMAIPSGLYGRIAPRSGLAYKHGIDVMAGVIDEDYRGEIGVILINLGDEDKQINIGDKIAQMIFENYTRCDFIEANDLDETNRGIGGFGSTDKPHRQAPTRRDEGFKLGQKTTIEKGLPTDMWANASFRLMRHDGEIYSCTEKGIPGICVVDSSGQVLDKFFV
jgi:dUTP pyrophosphatase